MKIKLKSLQKTVAASATPEPIASAVFPTNFCKIKALSTNTGACFIGDSTAQLFELMPNAELNLSELLTGIDSVDLKDIYVKVGTNGNGVSVIYAENK